MRTADSHKGTARANATGLTMFDNLDLMVRTDIEKIPGDLQILRYSQRGGEARTRVRNS